MKDASTKLVDQIFGANPHKPKEWSVHVVNLSQLTQDLMPFVLGSLLEMFAAEIFARGPGKTHPTVLALEEAHHYLCQIPNDTETGRHVIAYERLAKEGRKFGLSLMISTQRPSEISTTVLAQCGTWTVFRLSNNSDQRTVSAAAETGEEYIVRQLPGLDRGEAIVFGVALPIPTRLFVTRPRPEPRSADPLFIEKWGNSTRKKMKSESDT